MSPVLNQFSIFSLPERSIFRLRKDGGNVLFSLKIVFSQINKKSPSFSLEYAYKEMGSSSNPQNISSMLSNGLGQLQCQAGLDSLVLLARVLIIISRVPLVKRR